MAITKEILTDKIEILEMGQIQIRTATRIVEDGNILSQSYTRQVCEPGVDITNQDPKVQAIAAAVWTSDVLSAWENFKSTQTQGD